MEPAIVDKCINYPFMRRTPLDLSMINCGKSHWGKLVELVGEVNADNDKTKANVSRALRGWAQEGLSIWIHISGSI